MTVRDEILDRLKRVGFETGVGALSPFGEALPLVTAWAVEHQTASLALVVEDPNGVADVDPWKELLFALSGLRHELRGSSAPALGTPVVVSVVRDEEHERRLRRLIETLSEQYVLFSRVELNMLVDDGRPLNIDRALAPLLPRCRTALRDGTTISHEVLATLASELSEALATLGESTDADLRPYSDEIARQYADELSGLIEPAEKAPGGTLAPLRAIDLFNFRSFTEQSAPLGQLTLIEGLNGTGKSSVIEALEILWTGSSQRKPPDERASAYDRHLPRDGMGHWKISALPRNGDEAEVRRDHTEEGAARGLPRNVYPQDGSVDIAGEAPSGRYSELLRVTGLAVPELISECERLNRQARDELNRVLSKLGIPSVRANSRGVDAARSALATFPKQPTPSLGSVRTAELRLSEIAAGAGIQYSPLDLESNVGSLVAALEDEALQVAARLSCTETFQAGVENLNAVLRTTSAAAAERARALDQLAATASAIERAERPASPRRAIATSPPSPLPRPVASTLLNAMRTLRRTVDELKSSEPSVDDPIWRDRLENFISKTIAALNVLPEEELEAMLERPREGSQAPPKVPAAPSSGEFKAAGFTAISPAALPSGLAAAAREVSGALREYASRNEEFARVLVDSPQMRLAGSEDDLIRALARFEVARALKGPVSQTQEQLLTRLLSGPLEPVLSELIGALTRFEWYFHPLRMSVRRGRVDLAGIATESEELDVRMLLNAGERSIVSLAWFLALYLLQPEDRRTVLILDDPFGALDENNRAALLATLQTITRLNRPVLFAVSTHDRITADAITREISPFRGWPDSIVHLAFARSADGTSEIDATSPEVVETDYEQELARIGIRSPRELTSQDA